MNDEIEKLEANTENILIVCCKFLNVDPEILLKKNRSRTMVLKRHMIFNIYRNVYKYSYYRISRIFNKDHTTIIHGINKLKDIMDVYPDAKQEYEELLTFTNQHLYDLHTSDSRCPCCGSNYNPTGNRGKRSTDRWTIDKK